MTKQMAVKKATALVESLPEGSHAVIVIQLPGESAQIVSSIDSDRDLAESLRIVAAGISPAGDA